MVKKNFLILFCSNILFLFYYIFIYLFIKTINLINDDCILGEKKRWGVLVKSGDVLVIQWGHFGKKWGVLVGGVLAVGRFDMYSLDRHMRERSNHVCC